MAKNIMRKNLRQSILKSLGRYIAIVGIIALGAGIFVGLRTTKADMVATGQEFTEEQNMFDLRLIGTYGWSDAQVEKIAALDGVNDAEGITTMDVLASLEDAEERVYKLMAIPEQVNKVYLLGGRMPTAPNECLYDGFHASDELLGATITLSTGNEDSVFTDLTEHTLTVVGYVSTPLYMDMSRGTTSLGSGSVSAYIYLPQEAFDVDFYSMVDITLDGDYEIYSEKYNAAMESAAERIEEAMAPISQERKEEVVLLAREEYEKGLAEYEDGFTQFEEARDEAMAELADAEQQLLDAQAELEENRVTLENGLKKLDQGQAEINANQKKLKQSKKELEQAKLDAEKQMEDAYSQLVENQKLAQENLPLVEDGIAQIEAGLPQLDDGISQLESGLQQLDMALSLYEGLNSVLESSINTAQSALDFAKEHGAGSISIAFLERNLAELTEKKAEYDAQLAQLNANKTEYSGQLEALKQQRQQLAEQKSQLEATRQELIDGLAAIEDGFVELENQRVLAEEEFSKAEQQILDGQRQLNSAQQQLDSSRTQLEEGRKALEEGEAELADAWVSYNTGRVDAVAELADAEAELKDAKQQLDDALVEIETMEDPEVFILNRNTNIGYASLDSNSDIVEGVSAVFPAFFLLIAALVCITTMTRMVEEERTQIGTLKALGYSNRAIIGKYLAYAGSAAVIGCGLGVVVGSVVFPLILWEAYGIIMLLKPGLTLLIDWPLCLTVVGVYTAVTLLVTWFCCRMALREVPAELIRPKAPVTGKKILLEYLPFWKHISFLNKVTLRNIFRYRQRLLMMLVGIGGCTALLLTGFGVRDSIVDIVDIQFENVTLFDLEVRFMEDMDQEEQQAFVDTVGSAASDIGFYHQSSVEVQFEDVTNDIIMLSSGSDITRFLDFHNGDTALRYPGRGEVMLSIGVAKRMGIEEGDSITIRNSDMQSMTLTVSGIFENYVNNYVVVTPETVQDAWGEAPAAQVACMHLSDGQDAHALGARLSEVEGVMNVSVNADIANQVGSMLEALNLIVITVVICAGLLAVIVLYNLTNINITERIREIATIKVLGFRAGESAMYVFKENLILSAMGALLGLPGGWALLSFVISKIQVDMVWFRPTLRPISYVWAIVLTMVFACIVDYALYFKLEKINMAEALKSVE